jgi:hypothetical protein
MITSFYYYQFAVFIPQTDESCLRLLSNKYISLLTEKISTHFCPVKGLKAVLTGEKEGERQTAAVLKIIDIPYHLSASFLVLTKAIDVAITSHPETYRGKRWL